MTGSEGFATVDAWLKDCIGPTDRCCPWAALRDLIHQAYHRQRIRRFLHSLFKSNLPEILIPQPAIVVIDQAEVLMRAYRAQFLVSIDSLVRVARNTDLVRLVLVVESENALKALELLYGGNLVDFFCVPKVSREAVVQMYGEAFAKVFDDCDSCLGIALDYTREPRRIDAKQYALKRRASHADNACLTAEITREEFHRATEHWKK